MERNVEMKQMAKWQTEADWAVAVAVVYQPTPNSYTTCRKVPHGLSQLARETKRRRLKRQSINAGANGVFAGLRLQRTLINTLINPSR